MAIYQQAYPRWQDLLDKNEKENNIVSKENLLPKQPILLENKKSLVFNVPTKFESTSAPTKERKFDIKQAIDNSFVSDNAKAIERTKIRTEAGMANPTKVASDTNITPPPVDNKGLSTISAANIATGISTLANVASSIYGATQASKMKPRLASYQAPIEAVLVNDNSSAIKTAGEENIDKSINTARSVYQKNGLVGMDGILLSKENDSLNQLSGQLAQYRTSIDSQNAQIENTVNAQNKQNAMQVDQFNVQTENQFEQYKSGLIGMGMKNATDAIQSGTESIFGNIMAGKQMNLSSITSEMSSILQQMEGKDPALIDPKLRSRLEQLKMQKSELEQSTFKV